jgi:hypothetical protein
MPTKNAEQQKGAGRAVVDVALNCGGGGENWEMRGQSAEALAWQA